MNRSSSFFKTTLSKFCLEVLLTKPSSYSVEIKKKYTYTKMNEKEVKLKKKIHSTTTRTTLNFLFKKIKGNKRKNIYKEDFILININNNNISISVCVYILN